MSKTCVCRSHVERIQLITAMGGNPPYRLRMTGERDGDTPGGAPAEVDELREEGG